MPARDTWSRDHKFLAALADHLDEHPGEWVTAAHLAGHLELNETETLATLNRLVQGGLVLKRPGFRPRASDRGERTPLELTPRGVRESGAWPTPETGLDRLIAALEAVEADQHEPEAKRSRARTILGALGGAGRDLGVDVMGAVIASQIN